MEQLLLLLLLLVAEEEEEDEVPAVKRANIFGSHHAFRSQFGSVGHHVSHSLTISLQTAVHASKLSSLPWHTSYLAQRRREPCSLSVAAGGPRRS